jgi:hypothetical protein
MGYFCTKREDKEGFGTSWPICGRVINPAVNPPGNATLPIFARLKH